MFSAEIKLTSPERSFSVNKGDLLLLYTKESIKNSKEPQPHLGVFSEVNDEGIMHLRDRAFILQLPLSVGQSRIANLRRAHINPIYNTKNLEGVYIEPEEIANHLATKTNGLEIYTSWVREMKRPYAQKRHDNRKET